MSDDKLIELDDRGHVRCKACDRPFYPHWIPSRGVFEELCYVCLPLCNPQEDEDNFLEGYLMDKLQEGE